MPTHLSILYKPAKQYFLLIAAWLVLGILPGQAAVVRSLADNWLVYHTAEGNYLPYDLELDRRVTSVSTWLYPAKDNYYLELSVPAGTDVYFNNHLWLGVTKVQTIHLKLDEIFAAESKAGNPVFLTLFNASGNIPIEKIGIVSKPVVTLKRARLRSSDDFEAINLPKQPLQNGSALTLLFISALFVLVRQIDPREYNLLLSMTDLFRNPFESYGAAARKIWTATNLLLMAGTSLAITYVLSMTSRYQEATGYINNWFLDWGLKPLPALVPILFFGFGIGYCLLKYLLINLTGALFQMGRITELHYFEFLRLTSFLSVVLIGLVILVYNAYLLTLHTLWTGLYVAVAISMLARVLKVGWISIQNRSIRLLYLIAYLCITEIVPMVVLLRVLVPLSN